MPYLVYTALLTQSGTDAPVATVLQNTLGGTVVLSYTGAGEYDVTLVGAFPANKTVIFPGNVVLQATRYVSAKWVDADTIKLHSIREGVGPDDGILSVTPLEIRVYP